MNPRDCDIDPKAFAHMRRQKEVNHAPYDPGCSPEERRQYEEICYTIDGVNAFEKLHPYDRGQTWRNVSSDRYGKKEEGQRIDHFVTSKSLIDRGGPMLVRDVQVFKGLGSSDHWPMLMTYKSKRLSNGDVQKHLLKVGVYSENFAPCLLEVGGNRKEINALSLPVFELEFSKKGERLGGQSCFLDTGCPFSIYNPDKNSSIETDPIFKHFVSEEVSRGREVTLLGVGGGQIKSSRTLKFEFYMGTVRPKSEVLVLSQHEPTLPKLLLGMEALVEDFEGIHIQPIEGKTALRCTFDVNSKVSFEGVGPNKIVWKTKKSLRKIRAHTEEIDLDFKGVAAMIRSRSSIERCCPEIEEDEDFGQEYAITLTRLQ